MTKCQYFGLEVRGWVGLMGKLVRRRLGSGRRLAQERILVQPQDDGCTVVMPVDFYLREKGKERV